MSDAKIINLQERLIENLKKIDSTYEGYAKSKGMTYITLSILEVIHEMKDACTQKQIVEATYYPKQTVNLAVKQFLESGYVEMKEIPADRRNKNIILTKKGREYAESIITPLEEADAAAMKQMGTEQGEELLRLAKRYCELYCANLGRIMER